MDMAQQISAIVIGIAFMGMGVLHFMRPKAFMAIMPPWVPLHREMVLLSGAAEFVLGLGVIIPQTRVLAGWGLLALLVAVFPANIHMAVNNIQIKGLKPMPTWALWARLPFQFVFMAWVWFAALYKRG